MKWVGPFASRKIIAVDKTAKKDTQPHKKKATRALLSAALILLLLGAPTFAALRPRTTPELLSREKSEWAEVLSLGVVPTFPAGGSYAAFANTVAKAFEKANPGALVSVREMLPYSLREAVASASAPDVVLFGAGAIDDPSGILMPLVGGMDTVRQEYLDAARYREQVYAIPVAAGGYVAIAHSEELKKTGADQALDWHDRLEAFRGKGSAVQCASRTYGYPAAAFVAITGGAALDYPNALPANIGSVRRELVWPEFALERKYASYIAGPHDLSRMRALEAGGRVSGWEALPGDGPAYTDLMLLVGVVRPECTQRASASDNTQRSAVAGALVTAFIGSDARGALTKLGLAASTEGELLYQGKDGLEQMEASLQGEVIVPNVFTFRAKVSGADNGLDGAAEYLYGMGWERELR